MTPRRPHVGHLLARLLPPVTGAAVVGLCLAGAPAGYGASASPAAQPETVAARDVTSVSRAGERPALDAAVQQSVNASIKAARAQVTALDKAARAERTAAAKQRAQARDKKAAAQAKKAADSARKNARKAARDASVLAAVVGVRYATSPLNVRVLPEASAKLRTVLDDGARVVITAKTSGAWRQVKLDGRAGWVRATYLTSSKPAAATPATARSARSTKAAASSASSSTTASPAKRRSVTVTRSSVSSSKGCASMSVESGLVAHAITVHRALCAQFPGIRSYGGRRAEAGSYHATGQAIDAMISNAAYGQQVANWARANASRLGIFEVIYNHHIWTTQRASEGWRSMSDRGSATANHEDHVHISVR